jgi:hypothetical protein
VIFEAFAENRGFQVQLAAIDAPYRPAIMALRDLILDVAAKTPAIGPIEETLKWGQPAFLPNTTKSGTTIRLGLPKTGGFAIYVHCQTSLIADFQTHFPREFSYEGNRAILFSDMESIKPDLLRLFIHNALTYHLK